MAYILQHGHVEIPLPAWRDKGRILSSESEDRNIWCNADAEIIGNKSCGNLILTIQKPHPVLTDALK